MMPEAFESDVYDLLWKLAPIFAALLFIAVALAAVKYYSQDQTRERAIQKILTKKQYRVRSLTTQDAVQYLVEVSSTQGLSWEIVTESDRKPKYFATEKKAGDFIERLLDIAIQNEDPETTIVRVYE
jgi:hypothetical protein